MAYVRRMRDLREDSDYTQAYVASVLGTSQTMYARYERGANEQGAAGNVRDEQARAARAHLLEQGDGPAALPHHGERRHAGILGRALDGVRARGVVLGQGVGGREGREALGVLVNELEQAEADVLGLTEDAGGGGAMKSE